MWTTTFHFTTEESHIFHVSSVLYGRTLPPFFSHVFSLSSKKITLKTIALGDFVFVSVKKGPTKCIIRSRKKQGKKTLYHRGGFCFPFSLGNLKFSRRAPKGTEQQHRNISSILFQALTAILLEDHVRQRQRYTSWLVCVPGIYWLESAELRTRGNVQSKNISILFRFPRMGGGLKNETRIFPCCSTQRRKKVFTG